MVFYLNQSIKTTDSYVAQSHNVARTSDGWSVNHMANLPSW